MITNNTNNQTLVCSRCNKPTTKDDSQYARLLGQTICNDCIEIEDEYDHCAYCNELIDLSKGEYYAEDGRTTYCYDCCQGILKFCPECEVYFNDFDWYGHCKYCETPLISFDEVSYNYEKIVPKFFDTTSILNTTDGTSSIVAHNDVVSSNEEPYMSVELDYDFRLGYERCRSTTYRTNMPVLKDVFYATYAILDGYLGGEYGIQMTSHYLTYQFWELPMIHNIMLKLFRELRANNAYLEDKFNYKIYLSNNDMTPAHMERFNLFFVIAKDLVNTISRRDDSHYDNAVVFEDNDRIEKSSSLTTITLNCFRSTYGVHKFYTTLSFVHSVYMFTKLDDSLAEYTDNNYNKEGVINTYMQYIKEQPLYDRLHATLVYIENYCKDDYSSDQYDDGTYYR